MKENLKNTITKYTWEIDSTKASNTYTGTISIFNIDAKTVIKKVTALVRTALTGYSAQVVASTGFNTTSKVITKTAHGYKTGTVLQVSTSDTLPAGISASTDYYALYITDNTFKITNAAGTVIAFTTQGTGNHTFTPTTLVMEVGDGDDADGFLKDTFAASTGYVGGSDNDTLLGDYIVSSGVKLEKYYAAEDTIDFKITGQAVAGKIDFYIESLGL